MVALALAAGLRRGELLGLEWSHIDLEKGTIKVEQTIVRGKAGKPVLKPPKRNQTRIVPISQSVVEELKEYYRYQRKEKMKVLDKWAEYEHDFVLCNWNGTHFYPTMPTTWWRRNVKRAGVRYIRLHDLRHTSATLLINQGVHAKIISARLGHADIRVTMDTYGHAPQAADKEAANKLDSLFANKKKTL